MSEVTVEDATATELVAEAEPVVEAVVGQLVAHQAAGRSLAADHARAAVELVPVDELVGEPAAPLAEELVECHTSLRWRFAGASSCCRCFFR